MTEKKTAEEIKNLLRQWELYKKDHWWDSTAINAEAVLMKEFAEAYAAQQSKIPTEDLSFAIETIEAEIDSLKDAYKTTSQEPLKREYSQRILSCKNALKVLSGFATR